MAISDYVLIHERSVNMTAEAIVILIILLATSVYIAFELGRGYQRNIDENNVRRLITKIESEKRR